MKITPKIAKNGISSYEDGFEDFYKTLRPSLKLWDFFVNWDKVFRKTKEIGKLRKFAYSIVDTYDFFDIKNNIILK